MRWVLAIVVALLSTLVMCVTSTSFAARPQPSSSSGKLKTSVVKIFTVSSRPNYDQPWAMKRQRQSSGSGCILQSGRILTNAHVVGDQVFLQVQRVGDTRRYTAKVEHVAHDSEVALLTVEEQAFFEGAVPVRLGGVPQQRDKVAAYGFPIGGNDLSITEGVVSRVEVSTYTHSWRKLLTIQTDAAINPGNSGGPVFTGGRLAGISFQSYSGTRVENIGYVVPTPIIRRVLEDVRDGHYDGVPALGVHTQNVENVSLRRYLGLPSDRTGVMITRVLHGSAASGLLAEGDVILAIDGTRVANDATVPFRGSERLHFTHLFARQQVGDTARVDVLRGRLKRTVEVELRPPVRLVVGPQYDRQPSYLVFAGLVFQPLTVDYVNTWSWAKAPSRYKHYYTNGLSSPGRRQVVLLTKVMPHAVNVGYHGVSQAVVTRVNGQTVRRLQDVVTALNQPVEALHVIELDDHSDFGTRLVLDAAETSAATAEVLKRYGIPRDRSSDLALEPNSE